MAFSSFSFLNVLLFYKLIPARYAPIDSSYNNTTFQTFLAALSASIVLTIYFILVFSKFKNVSNIPMFLFIVHPCG
jgi:hypothetical protein